MRQDDGDQHAGVFHREQAVRHAAAQKQHLPGLQLLHAVTFAMGYLGGIYFIANWTDEDIAAEAQGFSYVVQQGMTVVALLGFGWFAGQFGAGAWLALGAFTFVGAVLVWISLRLRPAHN
jgi:PPP family 3-phenylpropionic acid transporter